MAGAPPGPYDRAAAHGFMVDPDAAAMSNMIADMAAMNCNSFRCMARHTTW
jgi:hypothetical protein